MERIVENLESIEGFLELRGWADQIGNSEVIGSLYLSKSTAWNGHDSCFLEHVHAVHEVWLHTEAFGTSES